MVCRVCAFSQLRFTHCNYILGTQNWGHVTFRQCNILQLHITIYKGNIVIILHITFIVIKDKKCFSGENHIYHRFLEYKIVKIYCVTLLMVASTSYKGISLKLLFMDGRLYRKVQKVI